MKVDPARHKSQPWRIHTLAPDFELLDVWEIPIQADPRRGETFDEFFEMAWDNGIETKSPITDALVRIRRAMGRVFGWDRTAPTIPGSGEHSLTERLSDDDRRMNRASTDQTLEAAFVRVRLVYRFRDEALLELHNMTIAALLHLGWVDLPGGYKTTELAVYVKSRGLASRLYLGLIEPFRGWFVYPAWTKHVARLWRDRNSRQ